MAKTERPSLSPKEGFFTSAMGTTSDAAQATHAQNWLVL